MDFMEGKELRREYGMRNRSLIMCTHRDQLAIGSSVVICITV